MMWWSGHWYWGALMMLAFWAAIVGLLYVAVRGGQWDRRPRPTARELLDERFVKGEITAEEYAEDKAVLEGRTRSTGR
jgi:putative membrane protein